MVGLNVRKRTKAKHIRANEPATLTRFLLYRLHTRVAGQDDDAEGKERKLAGDCGQRFDLEGKN